MKDKENDNGSRESKKRGDSEEEREKTAGIDPALQIEDLFGAGGPPKKDKSASQAKQVDRATLQEQNVVANQNERFKATKGVKFYEQDRNLLEKVEKEK